jgi:ribose-phosphate pyrophosphokinase
LSGGWTLCTFEDGAPQAEALGRALGVPVQRVACHRFPDGESRVRVDPCPERALIYRSLHQPNEKLIEILLLASVLRDHGRQRPLLVCPYLPYMRQDVAFRPGEAVSQRVVGELLARAHAAVITVDPHLHRTPSLDTVLPGSVAVALSAAPALGQLVRCDAARAPLLVGPDCESEPLVAAVARHAGTPFLVLEKTRQDDRNVRVTRSRGDAIGGRHVVLVDDMASTGGTLVRAAKLVQEAGCSGVEALVVHALFDAAAAAALAAAGIERVRSSDSVPHPTNSAPLAALLAESIRPLLAPPRS